MIATGSKDGSIGVYGLEDGQLKAVLSEHKGSICSLCCFVN